MWLYTPEFFVSLVDNREGYPASAGYHLTARFRRLEHATAFAKIALAKMRDLPEFERGPRVLEQGQYDLGFITETLDRDYQYRLYISRDLLTQVLTWYVQERLLYRNFKDAVEDPRDHRTYGQVWGVTNELADA